jgi:Tfp pilus assembly protein PilF
MQEGQLEKAEHMFRACLALEQERDPKLDTARTPLLSLSFANLGMVFRRRERHDDAVPILKQSLQNLSKFPAQVMMMSLFLLSAYASLTLIARRTTTHS